MQIIIDLFNSLFLGPVVNLLVLILQGLQAAHIPGALGFAIIILTIIIRLLVWPFMATQLKSAKKMADIKPHMDELKKKHQDNKQALAAAQMQLYKEHGINPAGGCLPSLIQIPIVIALYQAISSFFNGQSGLDHINSLLYSPSLHLNSTPGVNFLGINLTQKPSEFSQVGILILLIPVITGALTFVQSKMMAPRPVKPYPSDSPKEKKEKESTEEAMSAVQGQMVFLMPIMVGYFAFQFPVGLSIYWNTFTLLGILQQYLLSGWGGMEPMLARFIKVEPRTKVMVKR